MSPHENTAGSPAKDRIPSSASSGMFMTSPVLENQYHADSSFVRITRRWSPSIVRRKVLTNSCIVFLPPKILRETATDLSRFGDEVLSKKVLDWVSDAERNVPYIRGI